jgi:hypothetical protein
MRYVRVFSVFVSSVNVYGFVCGCAVCSCWVVSMHSCCAAILVLSCWNVFVTSVLLSGVHFLQCFEYWVVRICVHVIHL